MDLCTRRAETGEMQHTREDFRSQACLGKRGDGRLHETPETAVARLITQRRPSRAASALSSDRRWARMAHRHAEARADRRQP
jgi:uncharacterized protein YkwD